MRVGANTPLAEGHAKVSGALRIGLLGGLIDGRAGDDIISGLGADDRCTLEGYLIGGQGNDTIYGAQETTTSLGVGTSSPTAAASSGRVRQVETSSMRVGAATMRTAMRE
jgi:Ca2+-binding RTX toxin-like protein